MCVHIPYVYTHTTHTLCLCMCVHIPTPLIHTHTPGISYRVYVFFDHTYPMSLQRPHIPYLYIKCVHIPTPHIHTHTPHIPYLPSPHTWTNQPTRPYMTTQKPYLSPPPYIYILYLSLLSHLDKSTHTVIHIYTYTLSLTPPIHTLPYTLSLPPLTPGKINPHPDTRLYIHVCLCLYT